MKIIREASEVVGGYRPKATITLQLKSVAVFDEKSKVEYLGLVLVPSKVVC